jgi:hypothetical protein
MHKRQVRMKLLQKHQNQSLTKCQKGDLVGYGGESGDSGVYIASVGSPFGRCNKFVLTRAALGTCGKVARVRTVLLTVHPVVAARIRTQSSPVRTIGLYSRLDSKRIPSGPLIRPYVNRDRPDAPHWNNRKLRKIHRNQIFPSQFQNTHV